jgi:peptidoglycan hydrolase-like protein with peptidoglycan-binding domain
MKGRDVQQDRRALTRAGFWPVNRTTKPPSFYDQPIYTHKLAMYVRRFQRAHKLKVTGEIDLATHNALSRAYKGKNGAVHAYGYYGKAGATVMTAVTKKLRAQEKYLLSSGSVKSRGVAAALMTVRHRSVIHYTQGALRMSGVTRKMYPPNYPHYADCSAHATWVYFVAGAPDPNGLGYNGYGYTGTQQRRGRSVRWQAAPILALAFYGRPIGHVGTVVKRGMVVSHGSEIGPLLVAINYRPVVLVKVYVLVQRPGFKPWPLRYAAA